jgi:class 3 adenylate cyclase
VNLKYGINLLVPLLTRSVIGRDVLAQIHDVDLTIMFTDIDGYSRATDRLGDHRAQDLVRTHNQIVRTALSEHGGIEVKHTGDGAMACFLSASRALECALAIQEAADRRNLATAGTTLKIAVGLNAGAPIREEGDLYGIAVILASRACETARGGQILVTDVVRQLSAGKDFSFRLVAEEPLEGLSEPQRLYAVERTAIGDRATTESPRRRAITAVGGLS